MSEEPARWSRTNDEYRCADLHVIRPDRQLMEDRKKAQPGTPRSGLSYAHVAEAGKRCTRITVSRTLFSREMDQVICGEGRTRTLCLPGQATVVCADAFLDAWALRGLRLNEGLQRVGKRAFSGSRLATVAVPQSVTELDDSAFSGCRDLRSVCFAPDARLERIGMSCFETSGLGEVRIPRSVTTIDVRAFAVCWQLGMLTVEPGS